MTLFKTLLKRLAQLLAALTGLVVLLYLVAVVINWNDVPPSELTQQFEASLENRPGVADEDNGYIALRDLAGSADQSFPRQLTESEYAAALAEDCGTDHDNCLQEVTKQQYGAKHWLDEQRWVLDRYIEMLSFTSFKEPVPAYAAKLISYGDAGYGQRLLMISAMLSAIDGDQSHVVALLEADLKFWRMVIANSDLLLTKIVAAAYVRNHFIQGNQALRELHKTHWRHTLPLTWLDKITEEERSLRRALVGEWHFAKNLYEASVSEHVYFADPAMGATTKLVEKVKMALVLPLFRAQDNMNIYAADLRMIGDAFEGSYRALPAAIEKNPGPFTIRPDPYSRVFNIAGDVLLSFEMSYTDFYTKTYDLEGVRRAAVVTTLMREQQVAARDVRAYLEESEYRNPYTDRPFEWNAEAQEVRFDGLRADHHDVYKLKY